MKTNELRELLMAQRGCSPTTIVSLTKPDLAAKSKTGEANPFLAALKNGTLLKRSQTNGMIGWVYQNSVNNQRVREDKQPDFIPIERKWGSRLATTPLVEHKGIYYLEVKVQAPLMHRYELDGKPLTETELERFLRERNESARQMLDKPVVLRDYRLDHIIQITLNGVVYDVETHK